MEVLSSWYWQWWGKWQNNWICSTSFVSTSTTCYTRWEGGNHMKQGHVWWPTTVGNPKSKLIITLQSEERKLQGIGCWNPNWSQVTWCHMNFPKCMIGLKYLLKYLCICIFLCHSVLHHCICLCTCILLYLLPACTCTKYCTIWILYFGFSPISSPPTNYLLIGYEPQADSLNTYNNC